MPNCLCNRAAYIHTVPAFDREVLHQRYIKRRNALFMAKSHKQKLWEIDWLMEDDGASYHITQHIFLALLVSTERVGVCVCAKGPYRLAIPHLFLIFLICHTLAFRLQPEMDTFMETNQNTPRPTHTPLP